MALAVTGCQLAATGTRGSGTPGSLGKRKKGLSRPDERSELNMGPPIDYSFKRLSSLDELDNDRPRALRVGRAPDRGASNRFKSASLWLNHNQLSDISGLAGLMHGLIEHPEALAWLDLSFNNITDIADDILKFPNLRILYLHGNQLTKLASVAKLRHLHALRNVTLRGNPLEEIPAYRSYVISLLPQIQRLDFVPISSGERENAPPAGFAKKKALLLK